MKEVKILNLADFARKATLNWPANKGKHEEIEQNLASWLNEGWQIEGTGGERLYDAFVILVRERQE